MTSYTKTPVYVSGMTPEILKMIFSTTEERSRYYNTIVTRSGHSPGSLGILYDNDKDNFYYIKPIANAEKWRELGIKTQVEAFIRSIGDIIIFYVINDGENLLGYLDLQDDRLKKYKDSDEILKEGKIQTIKKEPDFGIKIDDDEIKEERVKNEEGIKDEEEIDLRGLDGFNDDSKKDEKEKSFSFSPYVEIAKKKDVKFTSDAYRRDYNLVNYKKIIKNLNNEFRSPETPNYNFPKINIDTIVNNMIGCIIPPGTISEERASIDYNINSKVSLKDRFVNLPIPADRVNQTSYKFDGKLQECCDKFIDTYIKRISDKPNSLDGDSAEDYHKLKAVLEHCLKRIFAQFTIKLKSKIETYLPIVVNYLRKEGTTELPVYDMVGINLFVYLKKQIIKYYNLKANKKGEALIGRKKINGKLIKPEQANSTDVQVAKLRTKLEADAFKVRNAYTYQYNLQGKNIVRQRNPDKPLIQYNKLFLKFFKTGLKFDSAIYFYIQSLFDDFFYKGFYSELIENRHIFYNDYAYLTGKLNFEGKNIADFGTILRIVLGDNFDIEKANNDSDLIIIQLIKILSAYFTSIPTISLNDLCKYTILYTDDGFLFTIKMLPSGTIKAIDFRKSSDVVITEEYLYFDAL